MQAASWQRAALLAPVLLALFVSLVNPGNLAFARLGQAVTAALNDPLSLFAERSPGERAPGALLSNKGPRERVLPVVREREPAAAAAAPAAAPAGAPAGLPDGGVLPMARGGDVFPPAFFYPAIGDGPNPGPPANPPDNPAPPTTPVPEPATWLLLLSGLLAGAGLRNRLRSAAP